MDLNTRITVVVSAVVGEVVHGYARERAGAELAPLAWSLGTSWALSGYVGADCSEDEVAGVLARWAQVLDLTQAAPSLAGSLAYDGTVEGRSVRIWGVVDRDVWERGG